MLECLIQHGADVNAGHDILMPPTPLKMATLMKMQPEFRAKGRALETLLLKYGAKKQEIDPNDDNGGESISLSDKECDKMFDLAKKGKIPKKIQQSQPKFIDVSIDKFFEMMKMINNPQ